MPRTILTVIVKPALPARGLLIRLIESAENQGYYLSCWSLPWPVWFRETQEQLEDYEAENWKRPITTGEAEQWIEALRYQTILIAPEPIESQGRDGVYYEFIFEDKHRKIHLSWDNEIPANWQVVWSVVERFLAIAHSPSEVT